MVNRIRFFFVCLVLMFVLPGVCLSRTGTPILFLLFARYMNLRRWRQPAPQVARREYPS